MKASVSQNSYEPGATLTLRSVITEYGLPVENRANVRARIIRPDETSSEKTIAEIEPGVFEATIIASMPGIYSIKVLGTGKTLRGSYFTREQLRTASVWKGGDNPFPTTTGHQRLCTLLMCILKEKTASKYLTSKGIDVRTLARCIKIYCKDIQSPETDINSDQSGPMREILTNPQLIRSLSEIVKIIESHESQTIK
jgi:hypothetical protein